MHGSGKSTLLNIIGMLDLLDKGAYTLDNVEIRNAKRVIVTVASKIKFNLL